jgi:hypothetical protein
LKPVRYKWLTQELMIKDHPVANVKEVIFDPRDLFLFSLLEITLVLGR